MAYLRLEDIQTIEAAHYTPAFRDKVDLIVMHSMESSEKPGTARNVANWFASETAPQASAHYCIDPVDVIRCVPDESVAWHAPGANRVSIGIELAGRAAQSVQDWNDDDSMAILIHAIELTALLCAKWKIPPVLATMMEVRLGIARGITTHAMVSQAFPKLGDHWDPGPGFPLEWFAGRVASRLQLSPPNIEEA